MKVNNSTQRLHSITDRHPVISQFVRYVEIPSPTVRPNHPQEKQMVENMRLVSKVIAGSFKALSEKIKIKVDPTGTLIIRVPPSNGHKEQQPIAFLGHMDIVPANLETPLRPIHPTFKVRQTKNGRVEFIASDGTTTLGADNKAGIAIVWDVVRHLLETKIPHTGIEIVISPDEEEDCKSLIDLDTRSLLAKDVINVDNSEIFHIVYGCSSCVEAVISISGLTGGHSGDQIHQRISAVSVLQEVLKSVGNGVISFNPSFPEQPLISKNIYQCELKDTASNAIPIGATLKFLLRSYSYEEQDKELERIRQELKKIEDRFHASGKKKLKIKFTVEENSYPPWEGSADSDIANRARLAAIDLGYSDKVVTQPMHASTQANFIASKQNQSGEHFSPIVIGPNIHNEHSTSEMVDWRSMLLTSQWLYKIVEMYGSDI